MHDLMEHVRAPSEFAQASEVVVDYLDRHVPMGVWMVSRHVEGRQLYVHVKDRDYGVGPGDSHAWDDSYCTHMLRGDGPRIAPDAAAVPAYATAGVNDLVDIGTYVGLPIAPDGDGDAFGTICGLSKQASSDDLLRHAPLLEAFGEMLTNVLRAETRATTLGRAALEHLEAAQRDELTGLPNRRGFNGALASHRQACEEFGRSVMVLVGDLDGLKQANDTHGHAAGDALLRTAASVLVDATRPDDTVARVGGDEFAVLMPDLESHRTRDVLDRLTRTLDQAGAPMSIGAAQLSLHHGLHDVVERADTAMYDAKRHRRG